MMKRIIALMVVLALFVMITPVGAVKPDTPNNDWMTFCTEEANPGIPWNAICWLRVEVLKLQEDVFGLDNRIDALEGGVAPVMKTGMAASGAHVNVPEGFTRWNCSISSAIRMYDVPLVSQENYGWATTPVWRESDNNWEIMCELRDPGYELIDSCSASWVLICDLAENYEPHPG